MDNIYYLIIFVRDYEIDVNRFTIDSDNLMLFVEIKNSIIIKDLLKNIHYGNHRTLENKLCQIKDNIVHIGSTYKRNKTTTYNYFFHLFKKSQCNFTIYSSNLREQYQDIANTTKLFYNDFNNSFIV